MFWDQHSNPVGAPSTKVESPPAKVLALCTKCFGTLGKGVPHDCSKSKKGGNLANIVNTTSPHTRAKLAATTIHNIASSDEGVSTRGGVLNLPSGSKSLPVTIGTPKAKPSDIKFSHSDMMNIQVSQNLSDRSLL